MAPLSDYKFEIDPDTLEASVMAPSAAKVAQDVGRWIANDHDGKVRAALIAMGWTPPNAESTKR